MKRRSFLGLFLGAVVAPSARTESIQDVIDRDMPSEWKTSPMEMIALSSRAPFAGLLQVGDTVTLSGDTRKFTIVAQGGGNIG